MWFEQLVGFKEESAAQVHQNLVVEGSTLRSRVNGKSYQCGQLEIPTLDALKKSAPSLDTYPGRIKVTEVVANVRQLHQTPSNKDAVFQAASQFNLLEMVNPNVTPESGVDGYEHDHTQGPACAIACGAGTIFRNYFVAVGGQMGQTEYAQIDCLEEIGTALDNPTRQCWTMRNGYALATKDGLAYITNHLNNLSADAYAELKGKLKIGVQWNTEVTTATTGHTVTQAYCSALPVGYSHVDASYWERFARLVLEATYEATFYVALKNYHATGCPKLFLTLVGGGVFGNESAWILDAIEKCLNQFMHTPLEVAIVSYGRSDERVKSLIEQWNS